MKRYLNLLSTALLIFCFAFSAFADIQTITLNTGFNHAANARYSRPASFNYQLANSVNHKDEYWTLVYDPSTTGVSAPPRQADIMPKHPAWKPEMPNSEWIAFERNGTPTANGQLGRAYVFEKCFCLRKGFDQDKEAYEKTKMDLQLRADDFAAVYLNESMANILNMPASNPFPPSPFTSIYNGSADPMAILKINLSAGGFAQPNPVQTTINASELMKRLRVGRNCLQVKLYDLGLVVSGFNLTGSITAAGIDEVAKFNPRNPRQQFSQCSACFNRRVMEEGPGVGIGSGTKTDVMAEPVKP